jgi:hypothetical protein
MIRVASARGNHAGRASARLPTQNRLGPHGGRVNAALAGEDEPPKVSPDKSDAEL